MLRFRTLGIILAMVPTCVCAGPFTKKNKIGDLFLSGSVFYAYGVAAGKNDGFGALQLTGSIAAAQLAAEGLKHVVQEPRPNKRDNLSFPSGHATGAFSGAMYVHRRYGWRYAIAPYVMSGIVSWQRVDARAHYIHDVIGGAAVSALFTWLLVNPMSASDNKQITVSADTNGFNLGMKMRF